MCIDCSSNSNNKDSIAYSDKDSNNTVEDTRSSISVYASQTEKYGNAHSSSYSIYSIAYSIEI